MIPTETQAKALWDKYNLSETKRTHVLWIYRLAQFLSQKLKEKGIGSINEELLRAGCLLHDIDKNIPKLPGETHPMTGVRILKEEGMEEVAALIENHSVQNIEDPQKSPRSWEEKLLFLSDKMVKQDIIGVDKRFELWYSEQDLPEEQKNMLRNVYPLVKSLEKEIFTLIEISPGDVANLVKRI